VTAAPDRRPAGGSAEGGTVAGVDFGRTWLRLALGNRSGSVLAQERVPTGPDRRPGAVIPLLIEGLRRLCAAAGLAPSGLAAVAIGAPGPLDPDRGVLLRPANLPGWDGVPLAALVEAALGAPCRVENDANLAALAEHRTGAGAGTRNFVYVTASSGIGAGLVFEGRLYRGSFGTAGELGHTVVDPSGPRCDCGNRGCLEAIASGTAIASRAERALAEAGSDADGPLGRRAAAGPLDGSAVAAAAAAGDPIAIGVLTSAAHQLGLALGGLVNLLGPDAIAVGGGVTQAGPLFWDALRRGLAAGSFPDILARCRVGPAQLGQDQGVMGAVAWAALAAGEG